MLVMLPVSAQKLIAEKTLIDVGKTGFQQPVTAVFEFRNKNVKRLRIESVAPDCNCTAVEYPRDVIGTGETFQIKMTSGDYPIEMGMMRIDKNELEFDDVNKGEQPVEQIHVYNNGTSLMRPNLMHLPSWLSATTAPEEIRPGRTATITVTLNSQQVSDYGLTQSSIYLAANPGDKATQDNLIGVSAVLLPAFQKLSAQQKQYAPKAYLSKEQVDIVFDGKSKKKDEIQLSNIGRTPLTISSLRMFTPGLKISLGKSTLQPGESTKLKITAERDELKKARTKPRILMITNDPDKSKVVININIK